MAETFGSRLSARLVALTLTQADLARYLSERGIRTTRQSVNAWCAGETRPSTWKRSAIYDFLAIPPKERGDWTELLLAKKDASSPLDEDDVPTEHGSAA
jgi:hypothetical protein